MNILVLNENFEVVDVIDSFNSLIWTDRYNTYGDFELHTIINQKILDVIKVDYYLTIRESKHTMIVEDIQINSDVESGNTITVKGKSLESILNRRIIWSQTRVRGSIQDVVEKLINENIIRPSDIRRKIPNFIFKRSNDFRINAMTIESQYTGDNLYEVICTVCETFGLGFKITLNDNNQFVFELYYGQDRSYSQEENPYVVFSPKFENILNSNYYFSNNEYKNTVLIAGEGEGSERKKVDFGNFSGMNRRELFVDARDISSRIESDNEDEEMIEMSIEEYNTKLFTRGLEKLKEHIKKEAFEGEIDYFSIYKYGVDYFIGDIVQIANEYGHEGKVYVSEVVTSQNESGYSIYPTFKTIGVE